MKKVLAIAPYSYLPYYSGGQKSIAQFLEWLGKEVQLSVVSVANNDFSLAKTYTGIPLLKNSFLKFFDISLVSKISNLVKKEGIDTIIWEHPYFAWLAFWVRKKTGARTIFHTHNIEYRRFCSLGKWWWPVLKVYEKWCFKNADFIFFINPEEKQFAIGNWGINPEKCKTVPFGVPIEGYPADKEACRSKIALKHNIKEGEKILLFNGLLNYKPNLDALKAVLDSINPLLLKQPSFRYKIIICGKSLLDELRNLQDYTDKNIIYTGFVDDIETYFKGADLFLNPVQSGGGIKTKMVEAIAYGTTVIATETGASGIEESVCGNKLKVVADNDWNGFAKLIINNPTSLSKTPIEYYDRYYWGNIVKKAFNNLTSNK